MTQSLDSKLAIKELKFQVKNLEDCVNDLIRSVEELFTRLSSLESEVRHPSGCTCQGCF